MSVYFVTCRKANAVKIGCSVDPHGRLPEIQSGCPIPLKLEATLPGLHAEEKAMHWRFSEHRIHGEWFTLAPEIELVIAANPAPDPPRRGPKGAVVRHRTITPILDAKQAARLGKPFPIGPSETDLAAGRRCLAHREAAGDITFPFRAKVDA
jgi:hypothetical protein